MNKKIAMSLMSIFAALTVTGGATFAAWTSTNTNQGNTFGAGDMVLQINSQGPVSTGVFALSNMVPGDVSDQPLTLANTGDADAATVKITGIPLAVNTELADKLTIMFFQDVDNNSVFSVGDVNLGSAHLSDPVWTTGGGYTLPGVTIAAGGSYLLGARITFDADADNSYQNKNLTFDINVTASQ